LKISRILLDMDCVLADFFAGAARVHGLDYATQVEPHWTPGVYGMEPGITAGRVAAGLRDPGLPVMTTEEFWGPINRERGFWESLAPLPWTEELFDLALTAASGPDEFFIVTSPSKCRECAAEKEDWLQKHLGRYAAGRMVPNRFKHTMAYTADGPALLIDDYDGNVDKFREAGGLAVLFPAHHNSFHELKRNPMRHVRESLEYVAARRRTP